MAKTFEAGEQKGWFAYFEITESKNKPTTFYITYVLHRLRMKKNTMLTIDKELVDLAKQFGVNLSELASAAIKEELAKIKNEQLIPAIKNLKLRNIGPVKRLDIKFTEGLNIIYGEGASGKSTILQAILYALGREQKYPITPTIREDTGSVELELFSNRLSRQISKRNRLKQEEPLLDDSGKPVNLVHLSSGDRQTLSIRGILKYADKNEAILLDDFFDSLDPEKAHILLGIMEKSKNQIILTTRSEAVTKIAKANLIKLPSPKTEKEIGY